MERSFSSECDIPSLAHIPADAGKYPTVKIATAFVNQADALEQFKSAVERLGSRIRV